MRTAQYIGLSPRAAIAVETLVVRDSGRVYSDGLTDDDAHLYEYIQSTPEIRAIEQRISLLEEQARKLRLEKQEMLQSMVPVYQEFLQMQPWSSGPMSFIGLQDNNGIPFDDLNWTEEETLDY